MGTTRSVGHKHTSDEISVDAAAFSGNLSPTDTDVQTALETLDAMTAGGGNALEVGKTPSESPDGSRVVFTVPDGEYQTGTLQVYLNGQRLTAGGTDYSETTPASGTFTFVTAPLTGDIIRCDYQTAPATAFAETLPSGALVPFSSIAPRTGWTYRYPIYQRLYTQPFANMPAARYWGVGGKIGNYLYSATGIVSGSVSSTVDRYDMSAGTWSTISPGGSAIAARTKAAGGVYDSKLYICGGDTNNSYAVSAKFDVFDPDTGNYSNLTDMPTARAGISCVVYQDPTDSLWYMMAIGGCTASTTYSKVVERYSFSAGTWASKTQMANTRRFLLAVWDGGNYIYAIGGYNGSNRNYVERYNITTDSWTTLTVMPTARRAFWGWYNTTSNQIVCGCGSASSELSSIEIYDVATDSWSNAGVTFDYAVNSTYAITDTDEIHYLCGGYITAAISYCRAVYTPNPQYLYERA